jgi:IS605 OrfB family transposase
LRTDANNIVVEDLKKIKEKTKQTKNGFKRKQHNRAFGDIPIAMLFDYLTYKASILGKKIVKVSPEYTSVKDCRGKTVGIRQGRRYYCVDGVQFDADINASVNIANKYLGKSEHPISYPSRTTYMGRLLSTNQSSFVDLNSEKILNSEQGQVAVSL